MQIEIAVTGVKVDPTPPSSSSKELPYQFTDLALPSGDFTLAAHSFSDPPRQPVIPTQGTARRINVMNSRLNRAVTFSC
jgi:hypothetical protein